MDTELEMLDGKENMRYRLTAQRNENDRVRFMLKIILKHSINMF